MSDTISIQTINELSEKLLATRKQIQMEEQALDALKIMRDELQKKLLGILNENKLKQWKTEDATISRKISTRYAITDKKAFIEDLKKSGLKHLITETTNDLWRVVSGELLKENRTFNGAEIETKEYISVSLAKPKAEEEPFERGWALDKDGEVIHD